MSGAKHKAHNVVVVSSATHIELPLGEIDKALPPIEAERRRISSIDAQQQPSCARQFSVLYSLSEHLFAGSTTLIAAEQVNALELKISGYVCHWQLRTSNDQIAYGRISGGDLSEPDRRVRIAEPMTVMGSRVGLAAVLNDRSSVQDSRERLKEGRLADKSQGVLVTCPSTSNRYYGCH